MNKHTLKLFIKNLHDTEQNAAMKLGQAQKRHRDALAHKETLLSYQNMYEQEWTKKAQSGMTSTTLQHYNQFIAHIQDAINRQDEVITRTQQASQEAFDTWREHYVRYQSIHTFLENIERKERRRRDRLEQDLQEEFVNTHLIRKVGTDFED